MRNVTLSTAAAAVAAAIRVALPGVAVLQKGHGLPDPDAAIRAAIARNTGTGVAVMIEEPIGVTVSPSVQSATVMTITLSVCLFSNKPQNEDEAAGGINLDPMDAIQRILVAICGMVPNSPQRPTITSGTITESIETTGALVYPLRVQIPVNFTP